MPSGLHRNTLEEHWSKKLGITRFFGMISYRWLDFQPVVQNYKMAYTDNFKSWKCLETVFLTYLCHQDYIETLGSEFKGFWNVVNWGPIWTRNHCVPLTRLVPPSCPPATAPWLRPRQPSKRAGASSNQENTSILGSGRVNIIPLVTLQQQEHPGLWKFRHSTKSNRSLNTNGLGEVWPEIKGFTMEVISSQ